MFSKRKNLISIISLAFTLMFATFCMLILMKNKNFEQEYAMELSFPSKKFYEEHYGCSFEKILSFWKFKTYELTDDGKKDDLIFKQMQLRIRNLVKSKDSINGIHLILNLKTKYEDVIRIFDICEIEKVQAYVLKDYDVWIIPGTNSEFNKNCPLRFPK